MQLSLFASESVMATKVTNKGGTLQGRSERGWWGYSPYISFFGPYNVDYVSTVQHGPNVPGWKLRIAQGLQAGTALSGIDRIPGRVTGYSRFNWSTAGPFPFGFGDPTYGIESVSGPWMPYHSTFTLNATDAYDKCVIGFLEKVGEVSQKFSSGTFAGELRQTLGMLKSPFRSLQRHLGSYITRVEKRAFMRIRIPGSPELARRRRIQHRNRVVSETWLEYSFGLRPLLHDINDATAALVSLSEVKPTWERISYTVVDKRVRDRYVISPTFSTNLFGVSFNIIEEESLLVRLIGAVSVDPTFQGKLDAFGLNILDVAPTIWELIPYSFLIDYFANVGGLVSALSTRQTGVRWKMRTVRKEITGRAVGKNHTYPYHYSGFPYIRSGSDSSSVSEAKYREIERQPWDIPLAPQLVFRIPGANTQWLNMAALFRTSRGLESRLRR